MQTGYMQKMINMKKKFSQFYENGNKISFFINHQFKNHKFILAANKRKIR